MDNSLKFTYWLVKYEDYDNINKTLDSDFLECHITKFKEEFKNGIYVAHDDFGFGYLELDELYWLERNKYKCRRFLTKKEDRKEKIKKLSKIK